MSEQTRVKIVYPESGGALPPEATTVAVKCAFGLTLGMVGILGAVVTGSD